MPRSFKYYWEGENRECPILIEDSSIRDIDSAAEFAVEKDFYLQEGWEREGNYPTLIIIDHDEVEHHFAVEMELNPYFNILNID